MENLQLEGTQESPKSSSLLLARLPKTRPNDYEHCPDTPDSDKLGAVTISLGSLVQWLTTHPLPFHNARSHLHSMCLCLVTGPQKKEISTSPLLGSLEASPKLCFPPYLSPSFLTQFMTAYFTFTCKASAVQQALILPHLDRNYHPSDVAH